VTEISNNVSGASHDPSRKNVIMLALSLAFAMSGASIIMTVSSLAGHMLAVDKSLATVPLALQMAFVMATTIPASMLMRRIGRRAGFIVGQGIGLTAGVICVIAIHQGSFVLFTVGSALFGSHNAFWQYYRFAAAETADAAFRSRAISLVMSGGVVAAICGPELAKFSRDLLAPFTFAGSYAIIGMLCVATVALLAFIDIPKPEARDLKETGRPLKEIGRQPLFVVAVLSAMVGYGVMALVMTATPIAMMVSGHEFDDSAFVIQWHALGMFAPSFFTGHLIQRFGALNIILVGAVMNLACVGVNLSGVEVLQFWGGLVLLGVGWNFMFIGGTSLLTETYRPAERAKVQAFNDFLVFGLVTVGSFSSGVMLSTFGWEAVNYAVIAPVLVAFTATVWLRLVHRSGANIA
jgi:predicted MFS family arabinose efflux permease